MKFIYILFLLFLFSCGKPSEKIYNHWLPATIDGKSNYLCRNVKTYITETNSYWSTECVQIKQVKQK